MKRHPHAGGIKPARKKLEDLYASEDGTPLANAFGIKKVVHPFVGMSPVPQDKFKDIWQNITNQPRAGKSVAYLHVPFCENHCLFCGFYQNAWHEDRGTRYTDAVIENLRRDADRPYQSQGPVHAVYFGGGTPTALSAKDLARLVEAVRTYMPLAPGCEITIEGRIYSFNTDKMKAVFDAGANRVSLGVQSFQDDLRRSMARKVSRKEIISFLEQLLAENRAAIVIDLIYGFPNQTMSMWEDDVRTAISLGLDGVDLYALNLIDGTPLQTAVDKGKFTPTPRTDFGAYYERGTELMSQARWETISTSHWRRTTRERNLYNLEVKTGANCLAFGSGAGGFLNGYSYRVGGDLNTYQDKIEASENPVAGLMKQSPYFELFNPIKGGMERGRLNLEWVSGELKRQTSLDLNDIAGPLFEQWQHAGLLVSKDGWIDLTTAGRFWQVTMTQNLLEWLNQNITEKTKAASVAAK